jgi:hypothetical protein
VGEWLEGPEYPVGVARTAAITYEVGGRSYVLVVSGGPYSGGPRNTACYYTLVGKYYDLAQFAGYQRCFDPTTEADERCAEFYDTNDDGFVDFADYPRLEEAFVGPGY